MASIKYVIELSVEEKEQLKAIVSKGTESARTILRANILLASDRNNKKHLTVSDSCGNGRSISLRNRHDSKGAHKLCEQRHGSSNSS